MPLLPPVVVVEPVPISPAVEPLVSPAPVAEPAVLPAVEPIDVLSVLMLDPEPVLLVLPVLVVAESL